MNLFEQQAIIKVIGVGGAGCNAVNRMIESGIEGVEFIAMNTDAQSLQTCYAETKIQLGESLTRGLGSGGDPEKGRAAAKETERQILEVLDGADMVFVTAGMGGGTGTGAGPHVAMLAQRLDILTVGVITKPFGFEGPKRRRSAEDGTAGMTASVDTLIVIPNDKLIETVESTTKVEEAFFKADEVLTHGVRGISSIVLNTGLINLDFADIRSVMKDAGLAVMGMGSGTGDNRASRAAELAASSPLLETGLDGATRLLVNVTAGDDFTLGEIQDVMEGLAKYTDADEGDVYLGHVLDNSLGDEVQVTILAAGMASAGSIPTIRPTEAEAVISEGIDRTPSRRGVEIPGPEPIDLEHIAVIEEAPEPVPAAVVSQEAEAESTEDIDFDIPTFLRRQRSGQ
jgi:cell division protein FtsZ